MDHPPSLPSRFSRGVAMVDARSPLYGFPRLPPNPVYLSPPYRSYRVYRFYVLSFLFYSCPLFHYETVLERQWHNWCFTVMKSSRVI